MGAGRVGITDLELEDVDFGLKGGILGIVVELTTPVVATVEAGPATEIALRKEDIEGGAPRTRTWGLSLGSRGSIRFNPAALLVGGGSDAENAIPVCASSLACCCANASVQPVCSTAGILATALRIPSGTQSLAHVSRSLRAPCTLTISNRLPIMM